ARPGKDLGRKEASFGPVPCFLHVPPPGDAVRDGATAPGHSCCASPPIGAVEDLAVGPVGQVLQQQEAGGLREEADRPVAQEDVDAARVGALEGGPGDGAHGADPVVARAGHAGGPHPSVVTPKGFFYVGASIANTLSSLCSENRPRT